MDKIEELQAEVRELGQAVLSLAEATQHALSLIQIAHRRDLAQDLGYQDLISEASRHATRARNLIRNRNYDEECGPRNETVGQSRYL